MANWNKLATDMVLGEDNIYREVVKPKSLFNLNEAQSSWDKHFNQNDPFSNTQEVGDLIKEMINHFNISESHLVYHFADYQSKL